MKPIYTLLNILLVAAMVTITACSGSSARSYISEIMEKENAACPQNLGNGFTLMSAALDGDTITYTYHVDDDAAPLLRMRVNRDTALDVVRGTASQPLQREFFSTIVEAGLDLQYVYTLDDGTELSVTLSPDDLKPILDSTPQSEQ